MPLPWALRCVAVLAAALQAAPSAANEAPWPVAGRQGLMRIVIVPMTQARDPAAYSRQIEQLCEPGLSCFLSFYTNSTGVPVSVPLPDAIDREPAAVFRRSSKQAAEQIRWSCRLGLPEADCF